MTDNRYQDPYSGSASYSNPTDNSTFGSTASVNSAAQHQQANSDFLHSGPTNGYAAPADAGMNGGFYQGAPQPVYMISKPTSAWAIWGLVLGLASVLMTAGITAPFGLWTSIVGMKQSKAGGTHSGYGLAVAGLVSSIIGMLILLFMIAYVVFIIVLWIYYMGATY